MRRNHVGDRSSCHRKIFLNWLEEEETTVEKQCKKDSIENGSTSELSDIDIERILHDEFEKRPVIDGQFNTITGWLDGTTGQQLPSDSCSIGILCSSHWEVLLHPQKSKTETLQKWWTENLEFIIPTTSYQKLLILEGR